jgi:glutathione peroxidase
MNALLLAMAMGGIPAGANTIYDFTLNNIDGESTPLKKFEGKVALVVNVASRCGNTPQYEGLQNLYNKYKDKGFVVLGFPANEFRGQEPGSNAEIKEFCTAKYGVTFPMFEKIVVKGDDINPLYKWLVDNGPRHEDIEWNFAKFLIGRDGKIVERFAPQTKPESEEIVSAVEKALG